MYKLLIVDDERIIRETIANLIDWAALGIRLVGSAKNGFEAYDIIVDDCPDIVMTDIKMPGFSGIELIEKVRLINESTQFVILSGYGEFEFAKIAMRFGVKYYLLKPCNESQIIDAMQRIVKELDSGLLRSNSEIGGVELKSILYHTVLMNIFSEVFICGDLLTVRARLFARYEHLLDFFKFPYVLFSFSTERTNRTLSSLEASFKSLGMRVDFSVLNSGDRFFVFFRSNLENDAIFEKINRAICADVGKIERRDLKNLTDAVWICLHELASVDSFIYSDGLDRLWFSRNDELLISTQRFISSLFESAEFPKNSFSDGYFSILRRKDLRFLKQVAISLIVSTLSQLSVLAILQATERLIAIYHAADVESVAAVIEGEIRKSARRRGVSEKQSGISSKIIAYVRNHIEDPRLSLKWIAENVLFMNEDYISRRFVKETDKKFSEFLTETRLEKAKEFLSGFDGDKISEIAVRTGFGNNPKYFSQIFKRYTGYSPSEYRDRFYLGPG